LTIVKRVEMKQVILIRRDLKLKAGKACSQSAHASVGASLATYVRFKGLFSEWEATGMKKVVLAVKSEKELLTIYAQAVQQGLPCYMVKDAGLTTFHGKPTLTAAAIGPADDWQLDPIVGHLKLL
jgi:peptidyl-tRNA hydrolase, PTH2 family